ncbi:hypothetical protein A2U01_0088678, partial [Trifolium medium]|nr:hypothetical protein [Trifolium medium]
MYLPPEPPDVVTIPLRQFSATVNTSMLLPRRVTTTIKKTPVTIPPLEPPDVVALCPPR